MEDFIKIVLSRPSHPANIGAAARAIKVMGFKKLVLVKPKIFPHPEANVLASGASDILNSALIFDELSSAVCEETLVYGLTARSRHFPLPVLTPREAANEIVLNPQKTALVFGSENGGLLNKEIDICHKIVTIQTGDIYSSLNLAHAVSICLHELRVILATNPKINKLGNPQGQPISEIIKLVDHLLEVMEEIDFLKNRKLKYTRTRLLNLFKRSIREASEIKMLRGFLTAVQKRNL